MKMVKRAKPRQQSIASMRDFIGCPLDRVGRSRRDPRIVPDTGKPHAIAAAFFSPVRRTLCRIFLLLLKRQCGENGEICGRIGPKKRDVRACLPKTNRSKGWPVRTEVVAKPAVAGHNF